MNINNNEMNHLENISYKVHLHKSDESGILLEFITWYSKSIELKMLRG